MSLSPAGEASGVAEKRSKADRPASRATAKTPAAKPAAAPRKRATPAKRPWPGVDPVAEAAAETVIDLAPAPASRLRPKHPRRGGSRIARGVVVLIAVAVAAALVLVTRWDRSPEPVPAAAPVAMSPDSLRSLAESRDTPIYWAGTLAGRELELTTTATGTFVRYLPAGAKSSNTKLALTIATYPLKGAYATAVRQTSEKGMASEVTDGGGLAVWRESQPTSVYLAFRGVPSLVEVYAPRAKDARTLALSGRIKPVG